MRKLLFALFSILLFAFNANAQIYKIAVDAAYPPFSFKKGILLSALSLICLRRSQNEKVFLMN